MPAACRLRDEDTRAETWGLVRRQYQSALNVSQPDRRISDLRELSPTANLIVQ
jgi:hypothetical protein